MSSWCLQVEALCEAAGVRLDVSSNRALSTSLEAACLAATDPASITLVKAAATRAMSEAEYCSTGDQNPAGYALHGLESPDAEGMHCKLVHTPWLSWACRDPCTCTPSSLHQVLNTAQSPKTLELRMYTQ